MQRPHGNAANECQDMERLAQYILRNPFSIAKMQVNRSGMNAKIKRNFSIHGSIHASIHGVRFHRGDHAAHSG